MQLMDQFVQGIIEKGFPSEWVILFVSSLPIVELRGGIPLGIGFYELSPTLVYFLAVLGNMIPVFFVTIFLRYFSDFLRNIWPWFDKHFTKYLNKLETLHKGKFEKWGALALFLFVAVPLPMTGAWSGTVVAFIFQVPLRYVFTYIPLGVAAAGLIITFLSMGLFS